MAREHYRTKYLPVTHTNAKNLIEADDLPIVVRQIVSAVADDADGADNEVIYTLRHGVYGSTNVRLATHELSDGSDAQVWEGYLVLNRGDALYVERAGQAITVRSIVSYSWTTPN